MRVLGLDPGLRITGYGCVETGDDRGSGARSGYGAGVRLVEAGVVRLTTRVAAAQAADPPSGSHRRSGSAAGLAEAKPRRISAASVSDRLLELESDLLAVLERLRPDAVAIERLYAHYAHPTTAIVMGHARGVMLLCVRRLGLELIELGATEVKKSLTGHGHASKHQMQDGVRAQLGLPGRPEPADVADAIAIALCALRRRGGRSE